MTIAPEYLPRKIEYPETDGKPMAEGDIQCRYLMYARRALDHHFQSSSNVYVSGSLLIYYEEGNPEAVIAPDAFVIFGVEKVDRRSYETWENNDRTPDFVLEVTSKFTRSQDHGPKKGTYAFLGVSEYFLYDPTGEYLKPPLQGFRLADGNYFAIATSTLTDGTVVLSSKVLQLELRLKDGSLRFYDPATGEMLRSYEEVDAALLTAEQARQAAEQARQAAEEKADRLAEKLRELGIDPNTL